MKTHEKYGLPGIEDTAYWEKVELRSRELGTDGCSGPALEVYVRACWEHDIHYRTHHTLFGVPLNRSDADAILFERHQELSVFDGWSPMAWWRWAAIRLFGGSSWQP